MPTLLGLMTSIQPPGIKQSERVGRHGPSHMSGSRNTNLASAVTACTELDDGPLFRQGPASPKGPRRVLVLLPIRMVIDLDARITASRTSLSRSKVIATAIRRYLDENHIDDLSPELEWSDLE